MVLVMSLPRLRAARVLRGLTQQGLAERSGVSRSTVRRVEAGQADVTGDVIRRFSRVLRVSSDTLLGIEPWELSEPGNDETPTDEVEMLAGISRRGSD